MKKKLEHIWYYYKWYFVVGAMILSVVLNFISERAAMVEPDWKIGLVTRQYVPEEEREALAVRFCDILPDRDGDGETLVNVMFYQYDGNTMEAGDTASFMASAVQLAADLQNRESVYYLTDVPELLLEADSTLRQGSGIDLTGLTTVEHFTLLARE